jgi:hypothetical protein
VGWLDGSHGDCGGRSDLVRTDGRGDKPGPSVTEQDIPYLGLPGVGGFRV